MIKSYLPSRLSFGLIPLLLILALIISAAFEGARRSVQTRLLNEAQTTAQSRVQTLESILAVQRAVAGTLADDWLARQALLHPNKEISEQVSRKLEYLRQETGSTIIYLLNAQGVTLSASNWREPISFVGGDYAFRDYYRQALSQGTALEYALGKDSNRPGLYLSHDIRHNNQLLGVIVVKMEFEAMEHSWARSQDLSFVVDPSERVVLASNPDWRFGPPPAQGGRLAVQEPVAGAPEWRLVVLTSGQPALEAGFMAALVAAIVATGVLTLRRRRLRTLQAQRALKEAQLKHHQELEQAVQDRTKALHAEIEERLAAEERLAHMQGELVQANKLATLGQVTAGLAHEVNQPLATIRLLADNGRALMGKDNEAVAQNLCQISEMTDRIDRITTQLRGFARKATGKLAKVSVKEAIEASILLTASRRRVRGAQLVVQGDSPHLRVHAEAVRLEQVLVNLIQNAQEALAQVSAPKITVSVSQDESNVFIEVRDNGPGIADDLRGQVFMPFMTTKSEGLGLGLVIARDIARDLGGELSLLPSSQGARFSLRLNRA